MKTVSGCLVKVISLKRTLVAMGSPAVIGHSVFAQVIYPDGQRWLGSIFYAPRLNLDFGWYRAELLAGDHSLRAFEILSAQAVQPPAPGFLDVAMISNSVGSPFSDSMSSFASSSVEKTPAFDSSSVQLICPGSGE